MIPLGWCLVRSESGQIYNHSAALQHVLHVSVILLLCDRCIAYANYINHMNIQKCILRTFDGFYFRYFTSPFIETMKHRLKPFSKMLARYYSIVLCLFLLFVTDYITEAEMARRLGDFYFSVVFVQKSK